MLGCRGGCWLGGGCPCPPQLLPCAAVIEEANWLTLEKDLEKPGDGFDAVICLGNSFSHLPDFKGEVWGRGEWTCAHLRVCPKSCREWGRGLRTMELLCHG